MHANGTVTTLFRHHNQRLFKPLSVMCGKGASAAGRPALAPQPPGTRALAPGHLPVPNLLPHRARVCAGPRGNSPAIRITKEQTGLSRDYYLGILHWTPQRGAVNSDTLERQCHEYIK